MTRAEENRARQALQHALDALADGAGHDTWGPWPVALRLARREPLSTVAFTAAALAVEKSLAWNDRARGLPAIQRLAPVFLDLLIEQDDPAAR